VVRRLRVSVSFISYVRWPSTVHSAPPRTDTNHGLLQTFGYWHENLKKMINFIHLKMSLTYELSAVRKQIAPYWCSGKHRWSKRDTQHNVRAFCNSTNESTARTMRRNAMSHVRISLYHSNGEKNIISVEKHATIIYHRPHLPQTHSSYPEIRLPGDRIRCREKHLVFRGVRCDLNCH